MYEWFLSWQLKLIFFLRVDAYVCVRVQACVFVFIHTLNYMQR